MVLEPCLDRSGTVKSDGASVGSVGLVVAGGGVTTTLGTGGGVDGVVV